MKCPKETIITALLVALTTTATAQPAPPEEPTWRSELTSLKTWGILAAGAIGAAYVLDDESPDTAQRMLDGSPLDVPMDVGDLYGSGWGVGALGVTTLAAGALSGSERTKDLGRDVLVSFAAASSASALLKAAFGRTRPNGGPYSFPSGHTTAAFSSVVPMWRHGGWKAGAPTALMATMTGLARMEEYRHYLSDVIAGAALGLAVGRIVCIGDDEDGWQVSAAPSGLVLTRALP